MKKIKFFKSYLEILKIWVTKPDTTYRVSNKLSMDVDLVAVRAREAWFEFFPRHEDPQHPSKEFNSRFVGGAKLYPNQGRRLAGYFDQTLIKRKAPDKDS
ncbi:hypothetical protein ElyMa_005462100 [Elysia marginata]|uniref:Uncharacterized protein n=1 Tax=Elysia marginata TaxID=1093978 RepID=A0AAV4EQE5_9GAST|nr:hypothetical protein ElyMa_005462100 [Elysia marginata]